MRIGYCAVTCDILHEGHVEFLKQCKDLCDYLIVGIMTDEIVAKYKGKKPIMSYNERSVVVSSIRFVDQIVPQDTFEFDKNIEKFKPTIVFDSEQHKRKGANTFIPYFEKISSSEIKVRIICEHLDNC